VGDQALPTAQPGFSRQRPSGEDRSRFRHDARAAHFESRPGHPEPGPGGQYGSQRGEHLRHARNTGELYRRFEAKVDMVMRQDHHACERLFIDYSGKRPVILEQ